MNSRLTGKIRNIDGSATSIKPIADDKGFPNKFGSDVLTKLADYEDLEEQGRLIKLPCKVGQHIYIVHQYGNWIDEASITGISEADNVDCFCFKVYIDPDCDEIIALKEFNETWFLTQSEAEAKLKELKGE